MTPFDYFQLALRVGVSLVPLLIALWDLSRADGERSRRGALVALAAGALVAANVLRLFGLDRLTPPASIIATTVAGVIFVEYLRRGRERAAAIRAARS